jgi:aminoglycoside phosphotransferase family enzyme
MVGANGAFSQTFEPSRVSLDDKIGFLSTPEGWPGRTRRVTVLQTHHAWLFMTDRYVYKMKKPFRAGGMNFSSLESRHRLCLDEYHLNRPLAAHTYLGVVPLVLTKTGNLAVNENGTVVEWLVKMRRLPESRTLTVLAAEDRLTDAHVADFVHKLSRFHELAPACRFERGTYGESLRDRLDSWHRELLRCRIGRSEPLPGLVTAQLKYLDVCSELLESRQREDHVRIVHGDLRPEHVFILEDEEPQIIDCLEFDVELRRLDVAAELAYFSMECRHAGFGRVAKRCISEYRSRCPGSLGPGHLMDFYASLAATVRAGLMGWRALETPVGDEWRQRTVAYLKDAQHYIDKVA